ncbi:MAG: hypothetical protein ACXWCP_22035, partial [Burkholderiales bacterium]
PGVLRRANFLEEGVALKWPTPACMLLVAFGGTYALSGAARFFSQRGRLTDSSRCSRHLA